MERFRHKFTPKKGGDGTLVTEAVRRTQQTVLNCRREGMTFQQIADQLNLSRIYVRKLYLKAMKAIISEDVDVVRKMELERLDILQAEVMNIMRTFTPVVNRGEVVYDTVLGENGLPILDEEGKPVKVKLQDMGPKIAAVNTAVRIMERRARLLGLDSPTKIAATDPTGQNSAPAVAFYLPETDVEETPQPASSGE